MTKLLIYSYLFFSTFSHLSAVNHWIVTQSGKIQAFLESPFDLRKPDDLLALLDQESRKNDISDLYEELVSRKAAIEKKWFDIEKNSNIGTRVTTEDVDCLAADKLFSDLDLYNNIATNGTERGITITVPKKIDMDKVKGSKELKVPLCMQLTPARWSESLVNKTNLAIKPEEALGKTFLPMKSLDHFGYYIVKALKDNSTSWVHYNLASFYWRIKGEGDKAIDCLKLAIQFVTGNFQDIPLHNLAGILHQSHHSKEAIQILNNAIQFAPKEPKHYFAMGNIYAAMRDFNNSVMNYEKFLELEPNNKDVAGHRHAVLCYYKLETALTRFQNDLQNILSELHDYHSVQQQWLRLEERLMWETASFDYQFEAINPEFVGTSKKVQRCIKRTTGGKPVISCDFYERVPEVEKLNLQNLFQIVEYEKQKLIVSHPLNLQKDDDFNLDKSALKEELVADMAFPKFPTSMPTKDNQYFDVTGWPRKDECLEWNLPVEDTEDLNLPIFLPPDNKGYMLKKALTDHINLPDGSQHDLPWYPPICEAENVNGEKFVPVTEKHQLDIERKPNEYLKRGLLRYVNDGNADEHEIGQRIISAMEKKVAPKWTLATLASLYWRVRGNVRRALDCLDMAFQNAPKDHTDVVLVSLSSTVYQLGLKEQASKFASLAFKINYVEPSTNFILALLHYENGNPLLAIYYLKNTLRVDPNFYDGLAERLLKIWSCRIKLGIGPKLIKQAPEIKYGHHQSSKSETGSCDDGLVNCRSEDMQCFKTEKQVVVDPSSLEHNSQLYKQCKDKVRNFGEQIMASLVAAETTFEDASDQDLKLAMSKDGLYYPHVHHRIHMGLSLGAEHFLKEYNKVGDFYVSLDVTENPDNEQRLHIYDKYGTYTLSSKVCQYSNLLGHFKYSQLWDFIKDKMVDVSPFIDENTVTKSIKEHNKPYCMQVLNPHMPYGLNEMTLKMLELKLTNSQDKDLTELLQLVCGGQKLSVRELGTKIAKALALDETNWQLLMASAIYWIIYGNTEQAVVCIRGAVTKVPMFHLDIPLIFLSHLLGNAGLEEESLKIAHVALSQNPTNLWNHFKAAEAYIRMNKFEEAVPYLRATLMIDDKFDAARIRLKAVLCKLLFEDGYNHGTITAKIVDN